MDAAQVTPPPGFTLDPPKPRASAQPEVTPPPGFTLDAPAELPQPGPVSRFVGSAWDQVNPVKGIVGLAKAIRHPIDTYNADAAARHQIGQEATADAKRGGIMGGASGIVKRLESFAPLIGPTLHQLGNQFDSGDFAGGMGSALGIAASVAGPEAVRGIVRPSKGIARGLESAADSQYRGALKAPKTSKAYQAAKVDRAVATGLEEGIPVSKAGREKLGALIEDLNQQISDIIATDPDKPISPAKAVANADALKAKFAEQVNPTADLAAIDASREDFLNQLRDPARSTALKAKKSRFGPASERESIQMDEGDTSFPTDEQIAEEIATADAEMRRELGIRISPLTAAERAERAMKPRKIRIYTGADVPELPEAFKRPAASRSYNKAKAAQQMRAMEKSWVGRDLEQETADLNAGIRKPRPVEEPLDMSGPPVDPGIRNLTATEAQAMKVGTYRQLKGRAYGELKGATIETQKALARGLKDDLAENFPELSGVNAREGGALDLDPFIEGRISQVAKHQAIGIGTPIAGAAVKSITGSSALAGAVGLIKAIYTPAVQSRVAIALHRASKGSISLPTATARVAGYVNALSQAVDAESSQPDARRASQ